MRFSEPSGGCKDLGGDPAWRDSSAMSLSFVGGNSAFTVHQVREKVPDVPSPVLALVMGKEHQVQNS